MRRLALAVWGCVVLALLVAVPSAAAAQRHYGPVKVTILGVNDFHGNVEPPTGFSGSIPWSADPAEPPAPAGGIEYLATHIARHRAVDPAHTIVVSAGDLVGASPLLSGLFHDEPTIEAWNEIGLAVSAVGNHELDEGLAELRRMQNGGCHPTEGCLDGDGFAGASFRFLAANVFERHHGSVRTIFPPYAVRSWDGLKVAFVGMTLEGTPQIVSPSGVRGLQFDDPAETVNRLVPRLQAQGIEAIVVLLHDGGYPTGLYNECPGISGPIVDIVERMSDAVDVVMSGHTHEAYNCRIDGKLVTSASSFGRVLTKVRISLDRRTHDVRRMTANNFIVDRTVPKDPAMTALIDRYSAIAAPLENRAVGSLGAAATRLANAAGESSLGDLVADSQLAEGERTGDAVLAFMNPGGIRTDLDAGDVTYGEAFAVQPFGDALVTMTLTGAQIEQVLEQQFDNPGPGELRVLQVSDGFAYAWDAGGLPGDRVDPASIALDGAPVDPAGSYRVTVNSFLADGGDGFSVFEDGTDRVGGDLDVDAFAAYLGTAGGPVTPGPQDRITRLG